MRNSAITLLAFVALIPLPLSAVTGASTPESHGDQDGALWLPWVGCWSDASSAQSNATSAQTPDEPFIVCFRSEVGQDGVELLTYAAGELVDRDVIPATGVATAVEDGGCEGNRTVTASPDRSRIFLSVDFNCGEGITRQTRTVFSFLPNDQGWIEVQSVRVDEGDPFLGIRSFVAAPPSLLAEHGISNPAEGVELAVQTARSRAAQPLTADELVAIVSRAGPAVAGALLVERNERFVLDARILRSLADRGVPGEVLDLMVAMSHPERFEVTGGTRNPQPEMLVAVAPARAPVAQRPVAPWPTRRVTIRAYSPWDVRWGTRYYDPFWSSYYSYGYSWYGSRRPPIGYGYRYSAYDPWRHGYPRVIPVQPPTVHDRTIRLDPQRGIVTEGASPPTRRATQRQPSTTTRSPSPSSTPRAQQAPPASRRSPPSTASQGRSGTRMTPQGATSSGGSSQGTRTAQPRSVD